MTYDELLIEADGAGLIVKEAPLLSGDGRCKGCRIAIRKDIPTLQKKADTWQKKWAISIPPLVTFWNKIQLIAANRNAQPGYGLIINRSDYKELYGPISISAEIRSRQPNILTYQRKPLRRP